MKKSLSFVLIFALQIVIISLLTSCMGNQVKRGVSSNLVSYLYPNGEMVSHKDDQMPILKLPLRVGIAFIPESQHDTTFTLTEVEKQILLQQVANKFKQDKAVSNIQIIPEIYLKQGKGFITISQIASLYDVDVVALVSYDQVAINELNDWSIAYWTIIGAFIVPGETTEFQTFVDTAVFDVKTKKMLFRSPGMHSDSRLHTGINFEKGNRQMRNDGFTQASMKMTDNLTIELAAFKQRIKQGGVVKVEFRTGYSGGGSAGWLGLLGLFLLVRFTRIKNS